MHMVISRIAGPSSLRRFYREMLQRWEERFTHYRWQSCKQIRRSAKAGLTGTTFRRSVVAGPAPVLLVLLGSVAWSN